jgi:hypothetical protein
MPKWEKGQSGNPTGKPKGAAAMAKYIREQTGNGQEVVEFFLNVFRDELHCGMTEKEIKVIIEKRIEAGKWLIDRGFGTALQIIAEDDSRLNDAEAEEIAMLEKMTPEELEEYSKMIEALEALQEKVKK